MPISDTSPAPVSPAHAQKLSTKVRVRATSTVIRSDRISFGRDLCRVTEARVAVRTVQCFVVCRLLGYGERTAAGNCGGFQVGLCYMASLSASLPAVVCWAQERLKGYINASLLRGLGWIALSSGASAGCFWRGPPTSRGSRFRVVDASKGPILPPRMGVGVIHRRVPEEYTDMSLLVAGTARGLPSSTSRGSPSRKSMTVTVYSHEAEDPLT
ncbi:hypothetical protein BO99DRAFT_401657 [Aspergillus violaceofuscus CBS 115571]|uniref:Uncharacterized protein n=1 Tax=Aspergillus violaceofuscus (strain CBS 115571) TaxID=1450538 RepID=A0A2V5H8U4_ASPV1|nr:hypothetical protein BO99DRAFT_401657 [Aspergillus violaceofuscus CBS 115571]